MCNRRRTDLAGRTRKTRGAALVEFAITLPLLLGLCMAAADFGRLFYHAITIANAAGAGAFYGARDKLLTGDFDGHQQRALDDMRNITAANVGPATVTTDSVQYCTYPSAPGSGGDGGSPIQARISILALARSQCTPALPRIRRLSALNPAHHLRRQAPKPVRPLTDVDGAG